MRQQLAAIAELDGASTQVCTDTQEDNIHSEHMLLAV